MGNAVTLNDVLQLVRQLSVQDKVRLIERVAPQIERDLQTGSAPLSAPTLRGLWKGLHISEDDLAAARREMWQDFPRSDL